MMKNIFNKFRKTLGDLITVTPYTNTKRGENLDAIRGLKNKYKGERCFVIGGSPSIKNLNLKKLEKEFVFTVSRGYKLKDEGLLHSTFHVISDHFGYRETIEEFDNNFSDIYFVSSDIPFVSPVNKYIFFDYVVSKNYKLEKNITKPLYSTHSVIGYALNIAYYLGFNEIILLGVDLDFNNINGHIYKESQGEKERQRTHSARNQDIMIKLLSKECTLLKKNGVNVLNASTKGNVDFIKRVNFEELF